MDKKIYPYWRQELKASQNKEASNTSNRWIQIATINRSNEPRLRTVVFRGWLKDNSMLVFTDNRTDKVKDIRNNNSVEILWLLTKSKSQFRFKGNANIVQDDSKYWKELGYKSRSTWYWPKPGSEYINKHFKEDIKQESKPKSFLVLEIIIHTVELLKLENPIHKRYIWKESENWIKKRINP